MSDALAERLGRMSPDQLVRLVDGLQGRIDALRRRVEVPIAVVGLALRLPGADSPDRFWELLRDGRVAITEVPPERWDAAPLAADGVPRWGGFIGAIDGFDAAFFRIPPAEAATMDPQQRLAAEIAWEALESAGYSLSERRPRATGVFLGVSTDDYKGRFIAGEAAAVDPRMATGTANSALAGRLSYMFDIGGPSLVVDTACSSSLVAAHLACRSLRAGECDMALAGGVGLLLEPELTVAFARLGMLSPRGLCSTFAEEADGYVRGEGAAMLVLRRLDDARRDGDAVLAVIRGSAVNQDGRSNGLTAPNGSAQRAVIAAALADAGIAAAEVDAVECHGTATPLGDPIEVMALGDAYGAGRAPDAPLLLGSVKANIGHLEAAAGAAGLAKAVLALAHRTLPPQPAHGALNPRVDWRALPVRIVDAPARLDPPGRPARIAVSSFGFAGTNAHMILEAAPAPEAAPVDAPTLVALSARSAAGLAELAKTVGEALSHPASLAGGVADIGRNLVLDRRLYPWRCAAAAGDPATLATALVAAAQTATAPSDTPPRIAFLFTGQGSQSPGMARGLYAREPAFRAAFDECAALLRPHLDVPLPELVWPTDPDGRARLDQTGNAQPALFAIEYALAALWRHWGVRPDVMVGHSIGEYAAACLAGVMDLADAAALVAARGRLMQSLPAGGGMMALAMPEAEAATWLSGHPALELAAVNAATTVAIAGPLDALEALAAELPAGVGTRLRVSHAFHSRAMEPILDRFGEVAARMRLRPPQHAIVSTVTGAPAGDELADPAYWVRQLRSPVRFAAAAEALGDIAAAVEIGPRPVLLSLLPQAGVRRLPSLRDGDAADVTILHSLADLFAAGAEIDWEAFHADRAGRRAPALPTPFARERYWTERPPKEALGAPAQLTDARPATIPAPAAQPAPAADALDILRGLLAEAMRLPAQSIPADIAFVELGADSLILMQVATGIERRFGVTVPRRELFASLDTLTKLHAHVATAAPSAAPQAPAPTPAAPSPPRIIPAPARPAAVEKPAARAHVAALAERLRTKTPGSWQSRAATGRELADSRASAGYRPEMQSLIYPLIGDRAEGAHIWDVDGNEYLDVTMGFGVQLFGHSAPFIRDALAGQLGRGLQLGPQARLAGEVAARLNRLTGVERVAFCNTGTEAVMTALRLARLASGRSKVALFQGSYHGHFDGVLASSADAAGAAMPLSLGTPQAFAQDLLILDYADQEASLTMLERHRGELAAVLIEPIQSRRPALQPRVFLRALREWTERAGVALIFDEVLLGFRIALGGAQAWAGVEADLVTYGKIIGGGLPIGVVAGRRALMDGLDGGAWQPGANAPNEATIFFAGTFNKNPLTMAASVAVLDRLEREGPELQEGLNRRTAALVARLNAALAERTPILRVDSAASLFRFRGAPDVFYYELLDRGVYVWEGRTCFLSTEHTEADLDRIVAAVAASADALVAAELLPGLDMAPAAVFASPAEESWPMTAQQRSLWLVCQISETVSAAYNQSLRITFAAELERAALTRALDRLVERHASLRARFDPDGQIMRAGPAAAVELKVLEGNVDAAEHDLCWEPFDLETGPMLRAATAAADDGWRLTLVLPHLVTDGWSFAVLVEELAALYRAERAGVAATLPPPDPPAGYAAAVAASAADSKLAETWLARFSPPPAPLDLPTLGPRPRIQGYRGGRVTHALGPERLARLRALCRREGVGLAAAGLAAYAVLLGRLGRSDDLAIGLLSAGQPVRGMPRLVGYCANLLPVRVVLAPSATPSELLALCQRAIDEAVDGRDYPFADLVRALKLPRDPSRPPLVSVGFNFDRVDGAPDFGTTVRFDANFHGAVRWDLFFNLVAGPDDIELQADFSAGLFDAAQVDAWAEECLALLDRFHDAPAAPLAPAAILARVAEHASLRGSVAAVEDGAVSLSYGELWREAGWLATRLSEAGGKPGDVVAADLGRGAAMLVAMLGAWRAGMVFMPIEPSYPADYRAKLIADSGAVCRLCVAGAEGPGPIPSLALSLGGAGRDSAAFDPPDPESPAYLVYTSGSTGTPKGILVPHRALAAYAAAVLERLDLPAYARPWRFALVSSFAADLGYTCVLSALASGGTLRVFQQDEMRDPASFAAAMAAVDVLKIVPTHLSALLEWPESAAILPARRLVLGGEASHWPLVERVWRLAPSCRVFNHYGPAETTVGVTCIELTPALQALSPDAVPLGRALGHATVRIELSEDGDDTGEILIGGAGVSLGYLRPDAPENARFRPDRNGPAGARLYRTGDRGRRLPDGLLMFLGRLDEEVKIRGHRVAPAAVAAMLRDCPGVRDAAALAESDSRGRARLLAFVAGPASLSEPEMRRWAAANLPPAMVPDAIVRLDELPRTANGKVDRDRLRTARPAAEAPAQTDADAGGALLTIWRDILGIPEAGPDDDFFALGGDSIMAIQIAGRARAIGLRFNAQILFEHPTVNELLAAVGPASPPPAVPVAPPPRQGAIPLTPVQRGFFQLRPPKPGHWGLSAILRLPPDTTADAVRRALPRVVGRHRALRLRFAGEGTEARQDLAAAAVLAPLTMLDHRGLDDAARRQAEDKAATELMAGIDLLGGALIGAAFIDRAAGENPALLVAVHHLVFDAVSWPVFADDLFDALDPAAEPAEAPGFDSWCRLLPAEAERRVGEMSHWQAVEARIAAVLPRLPNPGANSEGNVAREAIRLPAEATAALRRATTAQQAGLQDATLAALLAALARWAPRGIGRGIVVNLEGHGREEIDPSLDLSRIVGWFTTHFPVAFDPDPEAAAGAQIAAVRDSLRSVPGRGLGYGLLRYLRPGSGLGRDPELSFNFLGTIDLGAGPAARFERVSVGVERDPATPRRHLLVVEAYVADGRLSIELLYAREAISADVAGAIRDAMTDWFVSSTVAAPVPPSTTLPDHLALTEDDLRALNTTLGLGT